MAIFFTADTHLGHANILKYCKRPFLSKAEWQMLDEGILFKPSITSLEKHDTTIIDNINRRVAPTDQLWILGDFCLGDRHVTKVYRDRIKCRDIRLIWGNHDQEDVGRVFVQNYLYKMIRYEGQDVFLCHYPMRSWHKSHHGSWSLFGHVHGNLGDVPHLLTLDVGVDTHHFEPWSWDEICEYMKPRIKAFQQYKASWKDKDFGGMAPGTHK